MKRIFLSTPNYQHKKNSGCLLGTSCPEQKVGTHATIYNKCHLFIQSKAFSTQNSVSFLKEGYLQHIN